MGFTKLKSPDQRLLSAPPGLSQLATSFLRSLAPRHPPFALSSLTIKLTPHVAPAHFAMCEDSAWINSPFHNLLYLEQNLRT